MVYTGPSDGCQLCRRRRIKCDGKRPHCQRCFIYKAECPGFDDVDNKFIKNPALVTVKRNQLHRNVSDPGQAEKAPSRPNVSIDSTVMSRSAPTSVDTSPEIPDFNSDWHWDTNPEYLSCTPALMLQQPSLIVSFDELSINSFVHDWTLSPSLDGESEIGYMEFLPAMFPTVPSNTDFSFALRAAAYASYGNQHNIPGMLRKSREYYGQALNALQKSIEMPVRATKDTTMASIILLQVFEHLTCENAFGMGNHDAGLRDLIHRRGCHRLGTLQGRSLTRIVMGYLYSRDVMFKQKTSNLMKQQCNFLGFKTEHPSLQRDADGRSVTDLLCDLTLASSLNLKDVTNRERAISILQSTISLDDSYEAWYSNLPPEWQRHEVNVSNLPHWLEGGVFPYTGLAHVYTSALKACHCLMYRTQFIKLHHTIVELARQLDIVDWSIIRGDNNNARILNFDRSVAFIRHLHDQVLATIPYILGQLRDPLDVSETAPGRAVGALYLLAPLADMKYDQYATPEQRRDAVRVMDFMSKRLGIHRATKGFMPTRPRIQPVDTPRSSDLLTPSMLSSYSMISHDQTGKALYGSINSGTPLFEDTPTSSTEIIHSSSMTPSATNNITISITTGSPKSMTRILTTSPNLTLAAPN